MNGTIALFVYDAQDAKGFRARIGKLMGLMTSYSYQVVRKEVDPLVVQPDFTLTLQNDDAVLVLMPLERGVTTGRHFVVSNLKCRLHVVTEDLLGDGHPAAGIVFIRLNFDSIPLAIAISGDHVESVPAPAFAPSNRAKAGGLGFLGPGLSGGENLDGQGMNLGFRRSIQTELHALRHGRIRTGDFPI